MSNTNAITFNYGDMKTSCTSAGQSISVLDSPIALLSIMETLGTSNATTYINALWNIASSSITTPDNLPLYMTSFGGYNNLGCFAVD